jgi:hypothetical protein
MNFTHARHRAPIAAATVFLLAHAATAMQTTFIAEQSLGFAPQDIAITPNGQLAVVRSAGPTGAQSVPTTDQVSLWRVSTGTRLPIANCSSSMGYGAITVGYSSDAIAITNDAAVVIGSSAFPSPSGPQPETRTQIDVLRLSGGPPRCGGSFTISGFTSGMAAGLASDVEITPDGTKAVVNHRNWIHVLDLTQEPAVITPVDLGHAGGPGPCYPGPQSDSVALTNDRAVVVTTRDVAGTPHAWVYILGLTTPISFVAIEEIGGLEESVRPHDVAITPDGTKAIVTCNDRFVLFDLATGARTDSPNNSSLDRTYGSPAVPVDSVELTNERAVLLAHKAATGQTHIEIWDISSSLQLISTFEGEAGYPPHDLAVAEIGGTTYALVHAGHPNPALQPLSGLDIVIKGVESSSPSFFPMPKTVVGSPFARPDLVFCSDSAAILAVEDGTLKPYGFSIGATMPGQQYTKWTASMQGIDMLPATPVKFPVYVQDTNQVYDVIPADLALDLSGSDVHVRNYAPPTDANPAVGRRDFWRGRFTPSASPSFLATVGTLGAEGDTPDLRLFAVDSVVSAGSYTVSISSLGTGVAARGRVHFAKTGP